MTVRRRLDGPDPPPAGGHGYGPAVACLYLRLVLVAGVSLRGASRVMETVGQALGVALRAPPTGRPAGSGCCGWDTPR